MGQYYRAIVKKDYNNYIYNREIIRNGKTEHTPAKLMEHSWWFNEYVNAICLDMYWRGGKHRVAWLGNYAEIYLILNNIESINGLNQEDIIKLIELDYYSDGIAVNETDFTLNSYYLVNHTKKEYIDCSKYFKNNVDHHGWCIHPLPILTCIGNGLGSGDYNNPTQDSTTQYIGSWAWDEISIYPYQPNIFKEIQPIFKEK